MSNVTPVYVRCFAEGSPGDWEAVCIDFDLAVQGDSFEEVYRALNEMIASYLATVSEYPAEEQARFLRRRAPWSLRTKFALRYLLAFLGWGSDKERHNFTASACPA